MKLEAQYSTTITRGDYDQGVRQDCAKCLVAQAIRRQVPGAQVSVASPQSVRINEHSRYRIIEGYNLIDEFDSGASPEVLVGRNLTIELACD